MKFIERVMESSTRIWGRVLFFIFANLGIYAFYAGVIQHEVLKEGVWIGFGLFLSYAGLLCSILLLVMVFFLLALLVNCIVWLFTGDWDSDVISNMFDGTGNVIKFVYLLIFGDWWLTHEV